MADDQTGAAAPAEKPIEIPDSAEVVVGGKKYQVGQLPLGTLRRMWPLFQRSAMNVDDRFDLACQVLVMGLKAVGGPDSFDEVKTNYDEVFTAYRKVAEISGLIAMGERAARMSNGAASTATSPIVV